uniref:Acyl-CoA dehydrogenase n=1 Tax=Cryptomonas curvata TaxID=233186 RepID=A0A7S0MM27_9CRYP
MFSAERWSVSPVIEKLKIKAKEAGLWNMWIPLEIDHKAQLGHGLTNEQYARLAEIMGAIPFASECFNCSAPDTGNMEVLIKYGNESQKEEWLRPLLEGRIRSAFAMTEPAVASSDATNIQGTMLRDGSDYVLDARKWFTSGAMDPRCRMCIFMGRTSTDPATAVHVRQSMVIVPLPHPQVEIVRPLTVYGYDDAPHGHAEMNFRQARVAGTGLILGEGRGFEVAQGRLGPGRIHHCMRLIGMAERALATLCRRSQSRVAFGKPLSEQGTIRRDIAMSRIEIEQVRLLVLNAARRMDQVGAARARGEIAMAKAATPLVVQNIIDRAVQAHGAAGFTGDTPLAYLWSAARWLRVADGPDEVHLESLAKLELRRHAPK